VPTVTLAGALIGRDSELATLTRLLAEAARGRGVSVLIEGEPGIGKSSLVRAALAEQAAAGFQVFWGSGDELGQALPLLPLLEGLKVREPSANPRRSSMLSLLRGEVAADRGTDTSAALAEQLLALVAEECASTPTVLVIDDLQWADHASITLWGRLARSVRQMPLLLVGMMRPVPQREELLALRRAVGGDARLTLSGLAGEAVAELVAALAGGRDGPDPLDAGHTVALVDHGGGDRGGVPGGDHNMAGGVGQNLRAVVEGHVHFLGRQAVGAIGPGVDGDEGAQALLVVDGVHGDARYRRVVRERLAHKHLRRRLTEAFDAGGQAGLAQVVVLAVVAHLDAEAPSHPGEEGAGPGDELGGIDGGVGAIGSVADEGNPAAAGAEHNSVRLLERAPGAPAGHRPAEGDQVAIAELGRVGGGGHAAMMPRPLSTG